MVDSLNWRYRAHRSRCCIDYLTKISGPFKRRPTHWTVTLKNSSFKESLIEFFVKRLEGWFSSTSINGKVLYANSEDKRYKFQPQCDKVFCTTYVNYCNRKEGDSWIFCHLSLVATPSNLVMRANDTESLVIAMACKQFYDTSLKLWLEAGTESQNTLQRHLTGKGKSYLFSC